MRRLSTPPVAADANDDVDAIKILSELQSHNALLRRELLDAGATIDRLAMTVRARGLLFGCETLACTKQKNQGARFDGGSARCAAGAFA